MNMKMKLLALSLLVLVVMLGSYFYFAKPAGAENVFFVKKTGNSDAAKTPIAVSLSMPATLKLNEPADIAIVVNSALDAPNTNVDLILPEGAALMSSDKAWKANLTANIPATFSAKIMMVKTGEWEIKAIAKRAIDQENSWGDMAMAYIGFSNSSQGTGGEK